MEPLEIQSPQPERSHGKLAAALALAAVGGAGVVIGAVAGSLSAPHYAAHLRGPSLKADDDQADPVLGGRHGTVIGGKPGSTGASVCPFYEKLGLRDSLVFQWQESCPGGAANCAQLCANPPEDWSTNCVCAGKQPVNKFPDTEWIAHPTQRQGLRVLGFAPFRSEAGGVECAEYRDDHFDPTSADAKKQAARLFSTLHECQHHRMNCAQHCKNRRSCVAFESDGPQAEACRSECVCENGEHLAVEPVPMCPLPLPSGDPRVRSGKAASGETVTLVQTESGHRCKPATQNTGLLTLSREQCVHFCLTPCEREAQFRADAKKPLMGQKIAQCDQSGKFKREHVWGSTGTKFCVREETGEATDC